MGLFSSKKKTKVHTQVQRLIEDNLLPDTAKTSIVSAIMSPDANVSVAESLLDGFMGSLALRARRMYAYAADHYTYGLPTCYLSATLKGEDIVKGVIEGELGHTITLDYFQFAPINSIHVGWKHLVDNYGYNETTNELAVLSVAHGATVYLKDMVAIFTEETFEEAANNSLVQWGRAPSSGYTPQRPAMADGTLADMVTPSTYIVDDEATEDSVEITYLYQKYEFPLGTPSTTLHTYESKLTLPITSYIETAEFYHVKYRYTDADVVHVGYWLYLDGSEEYPEIDSIHQEDYIELGSYYPFVHFRDDKVNLAGPGMAGTPDYETSTKLLKYIGMDYQDITDSIHENPDIGDVEQAMLIMAIPAVPTHEIERRYLFDYFSAMLYASGATFGTTDASLSEKIQGYSTSSSRAIVIQDREFSMTLSFGSISKKRYAGHIAAVGEHTVGVGSVTHENEVRGRSGTVGVVSSRVKEEVTEYIYYRRQITDSHYDEVRVYNLNLVYHIYRSYGYSAGFGSDTLMIPLDHAITDQYTLPDRERLYALSLHLVFNTRVTTKVKWYQSGWFKFVMIIVAIVIAIYTWNPGPLAAALAAGAYVAAAWIIVTNIIIGLLIQTAFKLFVKAVGGELALILAAIATVVALVSGYYAGSVEGAPWAQELLMASTGLTDAVQSDYENLLDELSKDFESFTSSAESMTKDLEKAQDLLAMNSLIDPFAFIAKEPLIVFGETPTDYFSRTIHSGNVGVLSLDAITLYTQSALTLPKLHETVGEETAETTV